MQELLEEIRGLRQDLRLQAAKVLTTEEAADYLRCHRKTVEKLARDFQITYHLVNKSKRFYRKDLDAYLAKNRFQALN